MLKEKKMPLWGNTDAANNEPHFPQMREVRVVTTLTTTNAVLAGNQVWFSANVPSTIVANMFVYGADDANNAISRVNKDLSFFDALSRIQSNRLDDQRCSIIDRNNSKTNGENVFNNNNNDEVTRDFIFLRCLFTPCFVCVFFSRLNASRYK